jgi:hypothetical protein
MIGYDFGMHCAGVLLLFPLLVIVIVLVLDLLLVMGVLRDPRVSHGQHNCAREYG